MKVGIELRDVLILDLEGDHLLRISRLGANIEQLLLEALIILKMVG